MITLPVLPEIVTLDPATIEVTIPVRLDPSPLSESNPEVDIPDVDNPTNSSVA